MSQHAAVSRHIEANLHDPDLSAGRIAQALGCSRRTIYRVFVASDGQGQLISHYIWRRRVERCAQIIRSGRDYDTLTKLAYSFGFSSSAHFCRLFKKHMGATPSSYACVFTSRTSGKRCTSATNFASRGD